MLFDALGDVAAAADGAEVAVGDAAPTGLAAVVDADGASDAAGADGDGDVVAAGVPQAATTARAQAGMNARKSLWFMLVRFST